MTAAVFRRHLKRLGYRSSSQAAHALGLPRSSVHRYWSGDRPVSVRVARMLALLEAAQPAPMDADVRRLLAGCEPVPGAVVPEPEPRSNFERGRDWSAVLRRAEADGLAVDGCLSELGARCAAFLQQTQAGACAS
jgi:hypothetical protein